MFRLLEITYTDKEVPALYDNFADETALTAEFDTKLGQAMKSEAIKAELLVAFDEKGKIYAQSFTSKEDSISLSPRLVWVSVSDGVESADQSKKTSVEELKADFYIKRGSAKKNVDVSTIAILGIDGKAVIINDYWSRPAQPQEEVGE